MSEQNNRSVVRSIFVSFRRVRVTSKTFDNEWAMIYTVREGKVTKMRSYEDTSAVGAAFE